jgi:hypothetical protein
MITLPEEFKVVTGASPETTNGGKTADFVSMKNGHWLWIVVTLKQAVGHATAITVKRATHVAGTGETTLANNVQIWANEDTAASDTLVRQTDAKAHTVTNDIKSKQIVFGIDPVSLGAGYDVVTVTAADSSQATNFWSVTYLMATRYPSATPPTVVTD